MAKYRREKEREKERNLALASELLPGNSSVLVVALNSDWSYWTYSAWSTRTHMYFKMTLRA